MLQAKNISKNFGDNVAVNAIDMHIEKGEIVALIGPNGAGKSTTMRLLAGFLQPDSGSVFIKNNNMAKSPIICKKDIGYLAETSGSYQAITVKEYLEFIAHSYNLKNVIKQITDTTKLTRTDKFLDKPIEYLSKGMKQRVFLAGSLIHNPEILILDEPTEGLDPNQKQEMYVLLKKISQEKVIILSTHVLEEIENICTRVIVIHNGKIVADKTPKEFKKIGGDMYKSFSKLTMEDK